MIACIPNGIRVIRIILILGLAVAMCTAFWWFTRPKPILVALVEVTTGNVEASVANTRAGSVEACQRTRLSPISGGRITYLGVKKGDHVKKGQVLLRLWNDDQQAELDVAKTQVGTSQKHIEEACAIAENAARDAARLAKLRVKGFISEGAEDKARFDAASRRAACEAAIADLLQAKARVKMTQVEQHRTVLTAPFDGVVANIVGEIGEYTTPSPPGIAMPPAIDLIDGSCLYIDAPMDEVDAPKIRVGQTARVSLDALPGQRLSGHVKRVAPYILAVEKQARTVDVEVALDRPEDNQALLVGFSADVEVILARREHVLRIPTATLLEGNQVLLYNPANKTLVARSVTIGVRNWEFAEVVDGLHEGERIVASLAREGVKPGATVAPEPAPETMKTN